MPNTLTNLHHSVQNIDINGCDCLAATDVTLNDIDIHINLHPEGEENDPQEGVNLHPDNFVRHLFDSLDQIVALEIAVACFEYHILLELGRVHTYIHIA